MERQVLDDERTEDAPEPPRLRQLRYLVNTLMLTMILGIITITVVLVIRLWPAAPDLPPSLPLPEGETAGAVTTAEDWIGVVTTDPTGAQRFHIFDRATGRPRTTVEIP